MPASVSKTCLVRFDNNKYSVAASAVGRPVEVYAYADRIVIRQEGRICAKRRNASGRDGWGIVLLVDPGIERGELARRKAHADQR